MRSLLLASILFGLSACGPGGWGNSSNNTDLTTDDDDSFGDDDDATGDDDDVTGSDETTAYPDEEEFFALALGAEWRYDELVSSDTLPVEDDVFVDVRARWAGPDLDPPWPADVVAFEIRVDRLFGQDLTHWYGLDGTGTLRWLKTRVQLDLLEFEDHVGDGSVVLETGADEEALIGRSFEAALMYGDYDGEDFSTSAETIETFMYGDGDEVEALGLLVSEGGDDVGLQYFKARWGLLGQQLELDGASVMWTITECSLCPGSAGL